MEGVEQREGARVVTTLFQDNRLARRIGYETFNGSFLSRPDWIARPRSLRQLQRAIARRPRTVGRGPVRLSGSNHTFNTLSLSPSLIVRTEALDRILGIDPLLQTVTVEAGVRIADINAALVPYNLALPIQASTSRPTAVGATATGVHGSDVSHPGGFPSLVRALTVVQADGNVKHLTGNPDADTNNDDPFAACACSLGCLAAVYSMTLQCEPRFAVEQHEGDMELDEFWDDLPSILRRWPLTQASIARDGQTVHVTRRRKRRLSSVVHPHDGVNPPGFEVLTTFAPSEPYLEAEAAVALPQVQEAVDLTLDFWNEQQQRVAPSSPLLLRFSGADQVSLLNMAAGRPTAHLSSFFGVDESPGDDALQQSLRRWSRFMIDELRARFHFGKTHDLRATDMPFLYQQDNAYARFVAVKRSWDPRGLFSNEAVRNLFDLDYS